MAKNIHIIIRDIKTIDKRGKVIFFSLIFAMLFIAFLTLYSAANSVAKEAPHFAADSANTSGGCDISVFGNTIYYVDSKQNGVIVKRTADREENINDITHCENIILKDGKIYYIGGIEERGIYTTDVFTGETKRIIAGTVKSFAFAEDNIIYISPPYNNCNLMLSDINGEYRKKITDFSVDSFSVYANNIYYSFQNGINYYNITADEHYIVSENIYADMMIADKKNLYIRQKDTGALLCTEILTGNTNILSDKKVNSFNRLGAKIYFSADDGMYSTDNPSSISNNVKEKFWIYDNKCFYFYENSIQQFDLL